MALHHHQPSQQRRIHHLRVALRFAATAEVVDGGVPLHRRHRSRFPSSSSSFQLSCRFLTVDFMGVVFGIFWQRRIADAVHHLHIQSHHFQGEDHFHFHQCVRPGSGIHHRTRLISINPPVKLTQLRTDSNGAVIQSSLVGIGEEGVVFGALDMRWNMYTAAAWISASLALTAVFLFLPFIFTEFNMAEKEAHWIQMRKINRNQGTSVIRFPGARPSPSNGGFLVLQKNQSSGTRSA